MQPLRLPILIPGVLYLLLTVDAMTPSPASAQVCSGAFGRIEEIRDISDTTKVPVPDARVQVTNVRQGDGWSDAQIAPIQCADSLKIARQLDVKLEMDRGTLTFLTDINPLSDCEPPACIRLPRPDTALFALGSVNESPQVRIVEGSLVVDWQEWDDAGRSCETAPAECLVVTSPTGEALITGTRVAFVTDPDSTMVYVEEGTVELRRDGTTLVAQPGELWVLAPTGIRQLLASGIVIGNGATPELSWDQVTRFHGQAVWGGGGFFSAIGALVSKAPTWAWWVGGGIVAGAVINEVAKDPTPDNQRAVVITIQLPR